MKQFQTLKNYLHAQEADDDIQSAIATTILCIAEVAVKIADLVARGPLARELGEARGDNTDGDVATGQTNKQIAAAHGVSPNTVKFHIKNLFEKLSVSNRSQAIALYLKS